MLLALLGCAAMENITLWQILTKDISELGKQRKRGIYMTEPSQFIFMTCFIMISLMIMISTTARCLMIETLFELYSTQNRKRYIYCCNICFIAGSCFVMSMSWTPLNKTAGHLFSAIIGIFLLIIGQIIDAFNYHSIYSTISKGIFECVLLFILPIVAMMCFIAWILYLGAIYEWIGVSFIMFEFLFYGYQAISIDKLIQEKIKTNLKSQVLPFSESMEYEAKQVSTTDII